ncbi:hypothetical protein [Rickettsia amblyommatis]|uniref:hypothetical protein n=1 Tax=Rickettsia amblyommatis TaxID=33989 RepID=UPI000A719D14|nr:hypothetical protein [Rickettsia amblyommatis]
MFNSIKNNKIFYLSSVNQLFKAGLRPQEMFFVFHDQWPSYTKKAVNLLFESAVENLTCAMLLGAEEAYCLYRSFIVAVLFTIFYRI